MSNNGNFDLSGVFHVQQDYLTDLSNSYPNVNNAPLIANYVLDLQKKTESINTSYQNADSSADAILTQQNNMIDIVSKEQTRLDEKKFLIDQAEMGEQRKVMLTNSNRLRNAEYTKIILCVVAGLVVHVILRAIKSRLIDEPSSQNIDALFIVLHLVNILIWSITMIYIYANIQSRSHINFNQLELPPPSMTGSSTPAIANYNNLFKDIGVCVSDSCCGENTTWNKEDGKCIESIESFTGSIYDYAKGAETTYSVENASTIGSAYNSELTTLPKFKQEDASQTIEPEQKFDINTATDDEIREDAKKNVDEMFAPSIKAMSSTIASSDKVDVGAALESSLKDADAKMDEMNSKVNSSIMTQTKCNFATMEQAYQSPGEVSPIGKNGIIPYSAKVNDNHELGYSEYNR